MQLSKFPSITKNNNKQTTNSNMVLQDALSDVDASKQFYKRIYFENNINIFYDDTVTTSKEHNIDLPELLVTKTSDRKSNLAKRIYICKSILPSNFN